MTHNQLHTAILATWPDATHEPYAGSGHIYTLPCGTPIAVWPGYMGPRVSVNFGPYSYTIPDAIGAAQDEARHLRDDEAAARLSAVWDQWMASNPVEDPRIARAEADQ